MLLTLGVAALFQGDADGAQPPLGPATLDPMARSWRSNPAEYEQARQAAQQALRRADQTRQTLDAFVAQHFDKWQRSQNASVKHEDTTSRPSQSALTLNPAWAELDQQQRLTRSRLVQLSERFTPLHPDVQQVELELAQVNERLASTPQYVAAAPIAPQQPETDLRSRSIPSRELTDRKREFAQFRAYKQAADEAMVAAERLIELEDDAWRRHQLALQQDWALASAPLPASTASPAAATRGAWLWLPLIALLIGGAVAAYRWVIGNRLLMSAEQARKAVRAPLIAVIPSRSSRPRTAAGMI